jgi:hypothetical protein
LTNFKALDLLPFDLSLESMMPPKDDTRIVRRKSPSGFVEAFEVKSARAGSRLASTRASSDQDKADYSKQLVLDGREIASYVIEKRTGKRR